MGVKQTKKDLFVCSCHNTEHQMVVLYDMDNIIRMMSKREIVSDMLFDHHTDEIINKDNG
jgi:hypothetical protein